MRRKLHDWFGWHAWMPVSDHQTLTSAMVVVVVCKCGLARFIGVNGPS